jgi:DNA-binding transcriptional LysR family regulator
MVSDSLKLPEDASNDAIQLLDRGVQEIDHARLANLLVRVRWDDLHTFIGVASCSSFRKAASPLKLSLNTIRFRIARLETTLETKLFLRTRSGLIITPEGKTVLHVAMGMNNLSSNLPFGEKSMALVKDGEIRICAADGLGNFWLAPRLIALQLALPGLVISLDSISDQTTVSPEDYDVFIGYQKPKQLDVVVRRVGTVHMMAFASREYIEKNGSPANFNEVSGHKCILQSAPGINHDLLKLFLGEERTSSAVSMKVNSSHALYSAIAGGLGIGPMPSFTSAISKRVKPIPLALNLKFDVWLSFNGFARASQPVREAIKWIENSFDSTTYPWFSEDFIHPDEFERLTGAQHVIGSLDQLVDVAPS